MKVQKISAAKAARNFSEILNRVKYRGESFVVERNHEPVCRIEPIKGRKPVTTDNFAEWWNGLPRPDDKFADDLEETHNMFRYVLKSPRKRRKPRALHSRPH